MQPQTDNVRTFSDGKPAEETILLTAGINLSFWGRLLFLFRPILVNVRIKCERSPGRVEEEFKAWNASHHQRKFDGVLSCYTWEHESWYDKRKSQKVS